MGDLKIAKIACYICLVLATCPAIDYYCNWYVTIIPVVIIFISTIGYKYTIKSLFVASLIVIIQLWGVYRAAPLATYFINGIIVFVPVFVSLFGNKNADTVFLKHYLQVSAFLFGITSITTIIGVNLFPGASRQLASGTAIYDTEIYTRINIGGYDFIYALVLYLPVISWLIINSKGKLKITNSILLILYLYCIYKSSYTIALILTAIVLFIVLINHKTRNSRKLYNTRKSKHKKYLILGCILLLFLVGSGSIQSILYWLSSIDPDAYTSDRLLQLAQLYESGSLNDVSTETNTERLEFYFIMINGFKSSPLLGNNLIDFQQGTVTGHSTILDLASGLGIVGLLLEFVLLFHLFRYSVCSSFSKSSLTTKSIWIIFIVASFVNPTFRMLIFFVIFPFTAYLQAFEKENL